MPKGKFEVQQRQLEQLPAHRPLLLYVVAPVYSKDYTLRTNQNKLYTAPPVAQQEEAAGAEAQQQQQLPSGVRLRASANFNLCLVEANPKSERLREQLSATLEHFREAAHKVIVLNAHGTKAGEVLLKADEPSDGRERVLLNGRELAQLVTPHTHGHNLHVIVFSCHGHTFSNQFYDFVQKSCPQEVMEVTAITYFTSEATPTSWDKITTAGNGHVEVTRELGEFVKTTVEPNSPYKVLDSKVQPSCTIL